MRKDQTYSNFLNMNQFKDSTLSLKGQAAWKTFLFNIYIESTEIHTQYSGENQVSEIT